MGLKRHSTLYLCYTKYIVRIRYTMKHLILAALLIAAPASAAEVGVRHTWGHSSSQVHGGRSTTRTHEFGNYTEQSSGRVRADGKRTNFTREASGGFRADTTETFQFGSQSTSGFSETSSFSR